MENSPSGYNALSLQHTFLRPPWEYVVTRLNCTTKNRREQECDMKTETRRSIWQGSFFIHQQNSSISHLRAHLSVNDDLWSFTNVLYVLQTYFHPPARPDHPLQGNIAQVGNHCITVSSLATRARLLLSMSEMWRRKCGTDHAYDTVIILSTYSIQICRLSTEFHWKLADNPSDQDDHQIYTNWTYSKPRISWTRMCGIFAHLG